MSVHSALVKIATAVNPAIMPDIRTMSGDEAASAFEQNDKANSRMLGHGVNMALQLNANNVFNDTADKIGLTRYTDGANNSLFTTGVDGNTDPNQLLGIHYLQTNRPGSMYSNLSGTSLASPALALPVGAGVGALYGLLNQDVGAGIGTVRGAASGLGSAIGAGLGAEAADSLANVNAIRSLSPGWQSAITKGTYYGGGLLGSLAAHALAKSLTKTEKEKEKERKKKKKD